MPTIVDVRFVKNETDNDFSISIFNILINTIASIATTGIKARNIDGQEINIIGSPILAWAKEGLDIKRIATTPKI